MATAIEIPLIETERLLLRKPAFADFEEYRKLMMSPRARYMGGPYDERGAWGLFSHDVAGWTLFGHGALMVERRSDGACIGQVGISHGPLFPEKELGWLLYEGFEGQGYATEAAAALRDWAFRELRLESLVSYFHPDNARSQAVARRLSAVPDPAAPRQDPEDVVMRHLRQAETRP